MQGGELPHCIVQLAFSATEGRPLSELSCLQFWWCGLQEGVMQGGELPHCILQLAFSATEGRSLGELNCLLASVPNRTESKHCPYVILDQYCVFVNVSHNFRGGMGVGGAALVLLECPCCQGRVLPFGSQSCLFHG